MSYCSGRPVLGKPISRSVSGFKQSMPASRSCSTSRSAGRRLAAAPAAGRLELELKRLRKYKLLIIDEIGYLAFDHDAANLVFQLVAARYEQGALLATSNMPFGRGGEIFSNELAAAMIDRLVHHAENVTLAGDSCRTRRRRAIPDQHTGPGTKLLKNTPEG